VLIKFSTRTTDNNTNCATVLMMQVVCLLNLFMLAILIETDNGDVRQLKFSA